MTLIILAISCGMVWLHLIALGLLGSKIFKDYAVARVATPLAVVFLLFFVEHFVGLGPNLVLLPFSSVLAGYLLWRDARTVFQNWAVETAFGLGLLYCFVWRYTFPAIDYDAERMPDFLWIQDYLRGNTLPATDRWMPPLHTDVYYNFQHYGAALIGRFFRLNPALTYQVAYCVMGGMILCAIFMAAWRLVRWAPGAWGVAIALFLGGTGLGPVMHLSLTHSIDSRMIVSYIGSIYDASMRTPIGNFLVRHMYHSSLNPPIFPVAPLSYTIVGGDYHPPLFGFALLALTILLIASHRREESPWQRSLLSGCVAATIPLSLIGNTWVFPLQATLVLAWFIYEHAARGRSAWRPGLAGLTVACLLAFPFLIGFLQHAGGGNMRPKITPPEYRANLPEWLAIFWPLVALMLLSLRNRSRGNLTSFLVLLLAILLAATELFYVKDYNAGTWERFNSTLKWWGWIYALGILALGALNFDSRSRFCRYASLVVILLPCAQTYDYALLFKYAPKKDAGHLEGYYWFAGDSPVRDMIESLKLLPDGICLESGVVSANTEASLVGTFGEKMLYMGWPAHENIWRGFPTEVRERVQEIDDFYHAKMTDPLQWLLARHVRYVLWLQRDNVNTNENFLPVWRKIASRYSWHHYVGNDTVWALGFWELTDPPK